MSETVVVTEIRKIIQAMTSNGDSFAFLHADKAWQNLVVDDEKDGWGTATQNADGLMLPIFCLDRPIRLKPRVVAGGGIERTYICMGMFLYKSEMENNPKKQEEIIAKSEQAVAEFTLRLDNAKSEIKSYTVGECYSIEHFTDADLTGHVIPFTIVPRFNPAVCLSEPDE